MKRDEDGYAIPLAGTADSRILYMVITANPDAGAWEIPEPIEVNPRGHVLTWIGDMHQPSQTIELYHECLMAIRVRYQQWVDWYINYIWVEHDMALTFSREIYGWPANLWEATDLRFHGSRIFG